MTRNRLLTTALDCARRRIPVRPAPPLHKQPGWLLRAVWTCGCGNPDCPEPGQHSADIGWTTRPAQVRRVWDVTEPPNLLIASTEELAIWRLPTYAGGYGRLLYEKQSPSLWPPTMKRPQGDWITCTLPAADPDDLKLAEGVEAIPPGTPVLIPPSRHPNGRLARWDGNHFPRHPLPTAEAVLATVQDAARRQSPANR